MSGCRVPNSLKSVFGKATGPWRPQAPAKEGDDPFERDGGCFCRAPLHFKRLRLSSRFSVMWYTENELDLSRKKNGQDRDVVVQDHKKHV